MGRKRAMLIARVVWDCVRVGVRREMSGRVRGRPAEIYAVASDMQTLHGHRTRVVLLGFTQAARSARETPRCMNGCEGCAI
jgi:hypothetical protein